MSFPTDKKVARYKGRYLSVALPGGRGRTPTGKRPVPTGTACRHGHRCVQRHRPLVPLPGPRGGAAEKEVGADVPGAWTSLCVSSCEDKAWGEARGAGAVSSLAGWQPPVRGVSEPL